MWMRSVYSSMVSEIGYDDQTGELLVRWAKSGKLSGYKGVSEDVAESLGAGNIASVGEYLNAEIKDQYPHRYR